MKKSEILQGTPTQTWLKARVVEYQRMQFPSSSAYLLSIFGTFLILVPPVHLYILVSLFLSIRLTRFRYIRFHANARATHIWPVVRAVNKTRSM